MGDDKSKKLSAAKRRLKEFQKRQLNEPGGSIEGDQNSGSGLVHQYVTEQHKLSGSADNIVSSPNVIDTSGYNAHNRLSNQFDNSATTEDLERLQRERNLSPSRVNAEELQQNHQQGSLEAQLEELKSYNMSLQKQILDERETFGEQLQVQLGQLREQIQIHAQTIGILVGEKSQLQAALSQAKLGSETKQSMKDIL